MSAAQHTPGPWTSQAGIIRTAGGAVAILPNGLYCVRSAARNADENQANARLIAAAPELLAGLEQVLHWIDCDCDRSKHSLEAARAAIAKAKGRP